MPLVVGLLVQAVKLSSLNLAVTSSHFSSHFQIHFFGLVEQKKLFWWYDGS